MIRPALLLVAFAVSAGCAVRYTDHNGRVQTLGLVWTSQEATTFARPSGSVKDTNSARLLLGRQQEAGIPRWIEMRAVGLIAENTTQQMDLTLGYKDSIWVFPAENAITDVDGVTSPNDPPLITVRQIPAPAAPSASIPTP